MKKLIQWLRWPEDRLKGVVPWFVVAWRVYWMPLIYVGLALAWCGVALAYGISKANRFWYDAT